MTDKHLIIFVWPREALLEEDFGTRMNLAKELFKDIPKVQAISVVGDTADKVLAVLGGPKETDSGLVLHAMRELALAGNDEDFNTSIIAAVEAFASYGHSGGSASVAIPMLHDLLQYKNLTPLTDDSDEWMNVEMGDTPCWQSRRNPQAFSNDGGKTYYLLSDIGDENQPKPIYKTAERNPS